MTKQEEIRAGIQAWVDKRFGVPNTFNTQLLYDFLVYLDEHGVVIAYEKDSILHKDCYAIEPLIKEKR